MTKVVAIYPLLEYKTGKESGLYTSTRFDLYINTKTKKKYTRGDVQLYSDTLSPLFAPFDKIPITIEQSKDYYIWKNFYNKKIRYNKSNSNLVDAYVSRQLMRG